MSDVTLAMWSCLCLCLMTAIGTWWYCGWITKVHKELSDEHFKAYERLFELRKSILEEMSSTWRGHYNRFMCNAYLDFLDTAYSARYGERNGWALRLPPEADAKDTIDLQYYFTDEEVDKIKAARAIYGDDLRLSNVDKRLGL